MIVEAVWDGTYTASCAKRLKLPSLKGAWLTEEIQILEEPVVDNGKLVALANCYSTLCFIVLRVRVKENSDKLKPTMANVGRKGEMEPISHAMPFPSTPQQTRHFMCQWCAAATSALKNEKWTTEKYICEWCGRKNFGSYVDNQPF